MRTLDIVGINLELWFGVDTRVIRQKDICIALVSIGFLCVFAHKDFTIEHCSRFICGNAFICFKRLTVGYLVVNGGVVGYVLLFLEPIRAIEIRLGVFPLYGNQCVVADKTTI